MGPPVAYHLDTLPPLCHPLSRVFSQPVSRPLPLYAGRVYIRVDVMFGHTTRDLSNDLRTDAAKLNAACQTYLGVTGAMFRTAKFVFYITTLLFTGYLIEAAGVQPFVAMTFAALLITGPEGVEAYLIRQGVIDSPESVADD